MLRFWQKLMVGLAMMTMVLGAAGPVLAVDVPADTALGVPGCTLLDSWKAIKADPTSNVKCNDINIFLIFLINVSRYLFGIVGALALVMFIYGGFMMIISQGNQEQIKKGTGAIMAAIIGIVIAFSGYALVKFAGEAIGIKSEFKLK